jgi:hypothetical protein
MGGVRDVPPPMHERGIAPFTIFGLSVVVAGAFAIYMGLAFSGTPTFDSAALPTIGGTLIAVVAFLFFGSRGPPND